MIADNIIYKDKAMLGRAERILALLFFFGEVCFCSGTYFDVFL